MSAGHWGFAQSVNTARGCRWSRRARRWSPRAWFPNLCPAQPWSRGEGLTLSHHPSSREGRVFYGCDLILAPSILWRLGGVCFGVADGRFLLSPKTTSTAYFLLKAAARKAHFTGFF